MPNGNDFRRKSVLCRGSALALGLALGSLISGSAVASTLLTIVQTRTIELAPAELYRQLSDTALIGLPGESTVTTGGTATEEDQFIRFNRNLGTLVEVRWDLDLRTGVSVESTAVCVSESGAIFSNCTNDTTSVGAVTGSFGIAAGESSSDLIVFDFPVSDTDFIPIDALLAVTSLQSSTNTFGCVFDPDECFATDITSVRVREQFTDDPSKYLDSGTGDITAGMSLGVQLFMNMRCSVGIGLGALCVTDSYAGANAVLEAQLSYTYAERTPPPPPGGGGGGDPSVVPLPASGILLLGGLGSLLAARRRAA